jgi:cytochrome c oxidase assembly protein subunit 15
MWLNRFCRFAAFATFCLIIAGGLVTSTESGLSVPDWPKSYGMWMPPMVGGVFYEHGHRMIASFVGFLTVILSIWIAFAEKRKWMKVLGFIALGAVITQGILGGITVIYLLPMPVSIGHATLAQSFFCLVVLLALFTSREWQTAPQRIHATQAQRRTFLLMALSVYIQLILGALVRHSGSALAITDFPLAQGRLIPEFTSTEVVIHFIHRAGAAVVFGMMLWTLFHVQKYFSGQQRFTRPAWLLGVLVCMQIGIGGWAVLSKTAVPVATAHVAVGALILATAVVLVVRAYRYLSVRENAPVALHELSTGAALHKVNTL